MGKVVRKMGMMGFYFMTVRLMYVIKGRSAITD